MSHSFITDPRVQQFVDDADALCEWLRYYDYPSCRFTTVVGAAIKPACMRALDRRAKKEASDVH